MDKKKATITIVLCAIIIIIAVTTIFLLIPTEKHKTCKQINKELYSYVLAIKKQDITYCGNTGNPAFCKAQIMKDTSFCDTHKDKNYCLAIITSNEKFCPENDWWCKADASKNPDYCEKMTAEEKEECKANIALNEEYYKQEELC